VNNLKVRHVPVLVNEVLSGLNVNLAPLKSQEIVDTKKYIDATVGAGGHTIEIVKRGGRVLGIDADPKMIEVARENLEFALRAGMPSGLDTCPTDNPDGCYTLICGNFREIYSIAQERGFNEVEGILFDLGISSLHYGFPRGFSFKNPDAPLDMRFNDQKQGVTAAMLLSALGIHDLEKMFAEVMPVYLSRKISVSIIEERRSKKIETVGDFIEILDKAGIKRKKSKFIGSISYSTLPFLALRLAVNNELESISIALPKAFSLLKSGGRMAVISFHSGEDKQVKNYFQTLVSSEKANIIYKKLIRPAQSEIGSNPRARSAKLRVLEKI